MNKPVFNDAYLIQKVESDTYIVIEKLERYRANDDIQNYKTMSDSLESLINIHMKSRSNNMNESQFFYNFVWTSLNNELHYLSKTISETLGQNDARAYRNKLIALDKLNMIYKKTEYEILRYKHITSINKENRNNKGE